MSDMQAGRLAGWVTHRLWKWVVIAVWAALLVPAMILAPKLTGAQTNDAAAWLPGDSESAEAIEVQERFWDPEEIEANVVFERTEGGITRADRDAVGAMASELQDLEHIIGKPAYELSESGEALLLHVKMNPGSGGWETIGEVADEIRDIGSDRPDGLSMHVAGPAGGAADSMEAFGGVDGILLLSAVGVVVLALLLTYRSPVLWLVPVISVLVSLAVSMGLVYLLAEYAGVTVNGQTFSILPILVLGAGTDYALLLVARYREELRHHEDRHAAMALALHRAGPAIVASAATVVLGLLCLMAADMSSTAGLGPVCAVGIVIALAAMLTLFPAMLVACGRWVFWPARPDFGTADHTAESIWARVGQRVARAPRLVWVATTLVLIALSTGMLGLDARGLEAKDSFTNTPESVVGDAIVAEHFDAGAGAPVFVFARADRVEPVLQAFAGSEGMVRQSVVPLAETVDGVVPLMGTMDSSSDSRRARDTVLRVRAAVHAVDGADALVTGQTAVLYVDMVDASARDNKVIIPIVLAVVFLILTLLLRAVVAPVLLLLTVVLSYGAAMGLSSLIFEHVLGFEGADAAFPLFVFVFLVALGIDYNIFLMTRVHEETKRVGTRAGALVGLQATGGVITSAGFVLAGTFAVLGTIPLVFAAEIGIAVALGVLLDTFIVRSVLVTALTLDLGRWMWWPSQLFHVDREISAAVAREEAAEATT